MNSLEVANYIFYMDIDEIIIKSGFIRKNELLHKKCESLLDLYCNLYRILEHEENIRFYHETANSNIELNKKVKKDIFIKWGEHTKLFPYDEEYSLSITPETIELIRIDIGNCETIDILILKLVNWLIVLDDHFIIVKMNYEATLNSHVPIDSYNSQALFQYRSKLYLYIKNRVRKEPRDQNHLKIRNLVKNVFVSKKEYPGYRVDHKSIYFDENKLIKDIVIGFVPGNIGYEDLNWNIANETTYNNRLLYNIQVIDEHSYFDSFINPYVEQLKNADFVFFPEFYTPYNSQIRLIELLKPSAKMIVPGSFHIDARVLGYQEERKVFNYSKVVIKDEEIDVFKMNPYNFDANKEYDGKLSPFKEKGGEENHSIINSNITFVETPYGRMVILICIDLIIDNVLNILIDRNVDIVIVMCSTPNPFGTHFEATIRKLARDCKASVIICNNSLGQKNNIDIVVNVPGALKPYQESNVDISVVTIERIISDIVDINSFTKG